MSFQIKFRPCKRLILLTLCLLSGSLCLPHITLAQQPVTRKKAATPRASNTAQKNLTPPTFTPKLVTLKQGTQSDPVDVKGRDLSLVKSARVILAGKASRGITAKLDQRWPTVKKVTLTAAKNCAVAHNYQLELLDQNKKPLLIISTSALKIEVVTPTPKPRATKTATPVKQSPSVPLSITQSDLVITKIDPGSCLIEPGKNQRINITIKNRGNTKAVIPREYFLYSYTQSKTGQTTNIKLDNSIILEPGETFTTNNDQLSFGANQEGRYSVVFKVDPENRISEKNENNNEKTFEYTVESQLPDLVITNISVETILPTPTDCRLRITLMNTGKKSTSNKKILIFGTDSKTGFKHISVQSTHSLAPGESRQYKADAIGLLLHSTVTWNFQVDPLSFIDEVNELNNYKSITFAIGSVQYKPPENAVVETQNIEGSSSNSDEHSNPNTLNPNSDNSPPSSGINGINNDVIGGSSQPEAQHDDAGQGESPPDGDDDKN